MKGLLIKDLYNLKQQAKFLLVLVAFYAFLGIQNNDISFLSGMLSMLAILLPITAISYDERSKWDRFALTMPVSRETLVQSKSLLSLLTLVFSLVMTLILLPLLGKHVLEDYWGILASTGAALLMISILMPLIFHFGVEKARYLMLILVLVPIVLLFLLRSLIRGPFPELAFIQNLSTNWLWLIPVFLILALWFSFKTSIQIYHRKEF